MARQRPPVDEPSGGSWMDTYGDLVTLLLTFFVLLYSFSSIDAAKWHELVESFTGSPPKALAAEDQGGIQTVELELETSPSPEASTPVEAQPPEDPPIAAPTLSPVPTPTLSPTPSPAPTPTPVPAAVEKPAAKPPDDAAIKALQQDFQQYFQGTDLSGQVTVIVKDSQLTLRLIASVIFEPGSDRLKPEAETVLTGAAEIINRHAAAVKSIRTEGHTDSVNPPEGDIESKWELAARRAAKVLQHVLARAALDPGTAYTVGYGSARPVASNETADGQEQNNRVDVVVTGVAAPS